MRKTKSRIKPTFFALAVCAMLAFAGSAAAQQPYFSEVGSNMDWLSLRSPHRGEPSEDKGVFRFAEERVVNANAQNSGALSTFDDGLLTWVVGFCTPWCENINVTMSGVELGPDETIYVFSPQGEDIQTFTWRDNMPNGYLQSLPIDADSIIVEFHSAAGRMPSFQVESVNLGFVGMQQIEQRMRSNSAKATGSFGASQMCQQNASCYPDVEDLARATCRLLINGGYYGSAVLIRNTADDGKPYAITSAHCFGTNEFKTCVARFGFEAPVCQNVVQSYYYEDIQGATLKVFIDKRDVALLLLNSLPSNRLRPYWSGWNLSDSYNFKPFCIHHPSGDVKKVSFGDGLHGSSTYYGNSSFGNPFDRGIHWQVTKWNIGSTEGGSSGSGLYNTKNQLIGCLTGGDATCGKMASDYFWQLGKSWYAVGDDGACLADFLDPTDSETTQMDGTYYRGAVPHDVFNAEYFATPLSEKFSDGGYLAGNNDFDTQYVAERFDTKEFNYTIRGVYVGVMRNQLKQIEAPEIVVWDDNNGMPGNEVYRQRVPNNTFKNNGVSYVSFDTPLTISGVFHVGVSIVESEKSSEKAGYYYYKGTEENTAHFFVSGAWRTYDFFGVEEEPTNCGLLVGLQVESSQTDTLVSVKGSDVRVQREQSLLRVQAEGLHSLWLTDINGKHWYTADNLTVSVATIDMHLMPSGIYVLHVESAAGKNAYKILNIK